MTSECFSTKWQVSNVSVVSCFCCNSPFRDLQAMIMTHNSIHICVNRWEWEIMRNWNTKRLWWNRLSGKAMLPKWWPSLAEEDIAERWRKSRKGEEFVDGRPLKLYQAAQRWLCALTLVASEMDILHFLHQKDFHQNSSFSKPKKHQNIKTTHFSPSVSRIFFYVPLGSPSSFPPPRIEHLGVSVTC